MTESGRRDGKEDLLWRRWYPVVVMLASNTSLYWRGRRGDGIDARLAVQVYAQLDPLLAHDLDVDVEQVPRIPNRVRM